MSFESPSTLLSAVASLVSVMIAAYLVIQGRRESPDIRFVSVPVKIDAATMNKTELGFDITLLFQNVGSRAGSLIKVALVCPAETEKGQIHAYVGLVASAPQSTYLPIVLQPYTATLVNANIFLRGIPNLKTLIVNRGDEARINVKYWVSTKPSRTAETGIAERCSYFGFKFEEFPPLY